MPMIWAGGFFLTEVSTPLVNWRWFLYFKHKHETVYKVCGILMTLVFFLGRIVYMPVFLVILDKNGMVGSLSKLVTLTLNRLPYRFIFTLRMTS
mmetsp:Transcript_36770/g.147088  ORF Transcript_36770/g.147088 Transcript_36770/m.147088 type:complete len:94 (+) Transcript_36770:656-937(+)